MKPLTAREWLEQERLSLLPHADFAAKVLADLDELDALNDLNSETAQDELADIARHLEDCPGADAASRAEWAAATLEQTLEAVGAGSIESIVSEARWLNDQFWTIWAVLEEADLVGRDDQAKEVDVYGLLRMFLPV